MNRIRSFANDYLLPLVISALVLRALIPAGFMPGHDAGMSLTAALCNAPATGNASTEVIEIAGSEAPSAIGAMHCDFCLVPVLGTAHAFPTVAPSAAIAFEPPALRQDALSSRFALERAQTPRAPPLV